MDSLGIAYAPSTIGPQVGTMHPLQKYVWRSFFMPLPPYFSMGQTDVGIGRLAGIQPSKDTSHDIRRSEQDRNQESP